MLPGQFRSGQVAMDFQTDNSELLTYSDVILQPDAGRTIVRPFVPQDPPGFGDPLVSRPQRIANRVLALANDEVEAVLDRLLIRLRDRMRDPEAHLLAMFDQVNGAAIVGHPV